MSPSPADRLRAIARRWIDVGWQSGDADAARELHAPRFTDHDSAGRPADRDGFMEGVRRLYAAFPDFRAEVEDLIVEPDAPGGEGSSGRVAGEAAAPATGKVAIRWSGRGAHRAEYLGASPTNRMVIFKGIEILRIENGLIIERWGEWDGLDLLDQLRGG